MRSRWRATVFLVLLIASGMGGYMTYHLSNTPDDINVGYIKPPLELSFFVEDPTIQISASINVSAYGASLWATLYISTSSPETVIVLSNLMDIGDLAKGKTQFQDLPAEAGGYADQHYVAIIPPFSVTSNAQPKGRFVTNFLLDPDSIRQDGGLYAARLPTIARLEIGNQSYPSIGIRGAAVKADAVAIGVLKLARGGFVAAGTREPLSTVFWEPNTLTSSVSLMDYQIGHRVRTGNLKVNVPSSGTLQGDGFTWTGGLGLAPALSVEDSSAQQARSTYTFLAGVLLATGAACLVALVQEGPASFPLRRRLKHEERRRGLAPSPPANVLPVNMTTVGDLAATTTPSNARSRQPHIDRLGLALGLGIATAVLLLRQRALPFKLLQQRRHDRADRDSRY